MPLKLLKQIFLFSAIASVALRIYVHITLIDPATGFYEPVNFLVTILNILLFLAAAGLLIPPLVRKQSPPMVLRTGGFVRAAAALSGLTAFYWAFSVCQELWNTMSGFQISDLLELMLRVLGSVAFPAAAGIIFLVIAVRGKETLRRAGLGGYVLLIPVLWQILVLLTHFMRYTASRSVSDQTLCILALIFAVPFLIAHGRMAASLDLQKGARQLVAFGLPFALFALTASGGILSDIAAVKEGYRLLAFSIPEAVFYLALGLYATALVFSLKETE